MAKKIISCSDFVNLKSRLQSEFSRRRYRGAINNASYDFTVFILWKSGGKRW